MAVKKSTGKLALRRFNTALAALSGEFESTAAAVIEREPTLK